jgi:HEAT repeat protein
MSLLYGLVLGMAGLAPSAGGSAPPTPDLARLAEMLRDRQHPRLQGQAALLIVQSDAAGATELIRLALQQTETPEAFCSMAAALQMCRNDHFNDDLLAALNGGGPVVRQAAADALASLADTHVLLQLQILAEDAKTDLAVRQAALGALGSSGRKEALPVLLHQLASTHDQLRQAAAKALEDLTGLPYGASTQRWQAWWKSRETMTNEAWLAERLAYQATRSRRLEASLDSTKSQLVQLHQQLYAHLTPADRLGHVQSLSDNEEPAVRALVVAWCLEQMPVCDAAGQRLLVDLLLRLSQDSMLGIQRQAILALGRLEDARAFEQLRRLLQSGPATVRAPAARAITQQALGSSPQARARQHQVVPLLQRALEDSSIETVVEAAEDLGLLGIPEAGPVLICLLSHPAPTVRLTAVQALERAADASVLDGLLKALVEPVVTIRFSLIGAVGHAAGDGQALSEGQRAGLLSRLVELMRRDSDPGVRSRAATVLGECGTPSLLPVLWQRVVANEDSRVQEKAWAAFMRVVIRSARLDVLTEWDRTIAQSGQGTRRLQLLTEASTNWKKVPAASRLAVPAAELLVQAELDQGKWSAALPIIRELVRAPALTAEADKYLGWLLKAGRLALKDGKRSEAAHICQEALPYLSASRNLAVDFERLKQAANESP